MSISIGDALLRLGIKPDGGLESGLSDAQDKTRGWLSNVSGMIAKGLGGALALGAAGIAAGVAAIGAGAGIAIGEAMAAEKVQAQLVQVIKATGGAAGVTAGMANELAMQLRDLAGGSDDAVLGAEAVLLRFQNIGSDVFPAVTQTALDLATVLKIDTTSAALLLGKALEAPGEGLLRLKAAGVVFSDQQKKVIDDLVAAGDAAGAQTYILNALNESVGGAAAAQAETFGGKWEIVKNHLLEVAEGVGNHLLPIMGDLFDKFIVPAIPLVEELGLVFGTFIDRLVEGDLTGALDALGDSSIVQGILNFLGIAGPEFYNFNTAVGTLIDTLRQGDLAGALTQVFGAETGAQIMGVLGQLQQFGDWFLNIGLPAFLDFAGVVWSQLGPGLQQLWVWINKLLMADLSIARQIIQFAFNHLPSVDILVGIVIGLIGPLVFLATAWANNWGNIQGITAQVSAFIMPFLELLQRWIAFILPPQIAALAFAWQNLLQPAIMAVSSFMTGTLLPAIVILVTWLATNIPAAIQASADVWYTVLLPAIQAVASWIGANLVPLFMAVAGLLRSVVGLAVTVLAGLLQNVLQPALAAVLSFISANILPILRELGSAINTTAGPAVKSFADVFLKGLTLALHGVEGAIKIVVGWLNDMKAAIDNIKLPPWLTPGSPTPFEMGLRGVSGALREVNAAMPEMLAPLAVGEDLQPWTPDMVATLMGIVTGRNVRSYAAGNAAGQGGVRIVQHNSVRDQWDIDEITWKILEIFNEMID